MTGSGRTPVAPRGATVETLALAAALWQVMHDAGLIQKQIARRLQWSEATVSRVLGGTYGLTGQQVTAWVDQCNVDDEVRETIMALILGCPRCGCNDMGHQNQ